jgi:hypothetical protein
MRRAGAIALLVVAGVVLGSLADAGVSATLPIENRYSRWNPSRPQRSSTEYIVLHTTEGGSRSALEKLRRNGEANYLVDLSGRVYRIIDANKLAKHAGLSLWQGRYALDRYSIGIEVVGYHDGFLNPAQIASLRELIRQLRSRYRIPSENVVPHAMVAYGRPNRFHPTDHRGRKRCGMVFAQPAMRESLGLTAAPVIDQDVDRGLLAVGDSILFGVLFPATREQ